MSSLKSDVSKIRLKKVWNKQNEYDNECIIKKPWCCKNMWNKKFRRNKFQNSNAIENKGKFRRIWNECMRNRIRRKEWNIVKEKKWSKKKVKTSEWIRTRWEWAKNFKKGEYVI